MYNYNQTSVLKATTGKRQIIKHMHGRVKNSFPEGYNSAAITQLMISVTYTKKGFVDVSLYVCSLYF